MQVIQPMWLWFRSREFWEHEECCASYS